MDWFLYDRDLRYEKVNSSLCQFGDEWIKCAFVCFINTFIPSNKCMFKVISDVAVDFDGMFTSSIYVVLLSLFLTHSYPVPSSVSIVDFEQVIVS